MYNDDYIDKQTAGRIALACIIQAVIDASAGDPTALSWFESTGRSWLQVLDIPFKPEWITKIQSGQLDC